MFRTNVYIDCFNLYHAIDDLGDGTLKWVDLHLLAQNILNKYQTLNEVKYFSAYATWRPDSYKRHRDYVSALEAQGVTSVMGRFKEKRLVCKAVCKQPYVTHEEKETDVNIGAHLVADALRGTFDTALILSADTDLSAVVRLTKEIVGPEKRICTVAPPGRYARGRELGHLFSITKGKLRASQLPDTVQTPRGPIHRPKQYQ